MCRHKGLSEAEAARVLELCLELNQGQDEGHRLAYPGEPPPPKKPGEGTASKPLDVEDFVGTTGGPGRLAYDVVQELEDMGLRHALPHLNPGGLLTLPATLAECGLEPLDVWPEAQQNRVAEHLAERPVRFLPCYFEPLLIHFGCQQALANLTEPGAMARAYQEAA